MTDEDPIEALHIAEGWLDAGRPDKAEDAILAALSRVRKQKARTHEGEV